MAHCEHDEHAHKHALAIVDDGDGRPCIIGAKCACSANIVNWRFDYARYGEDFTIFVEHKTSKRQYLCHSDGGKVSVVEPVYIVEQHAANNTAIYVSSDADMSPFRRIDRLGNINVLKTPNHICHKGWISAAAAIDDSVLITSKYDIGEVDLRLTDIASDRITRSETNMNRNNILWSITPYEPNTWVASVYSRPYMCVYDDRVPEWMTTQYYPKIHKRGNEFAISSCVGTITLFTDFNFQFGVPTVISALDLRNGDQFDLATVCRNVNIAHIVL